MTINNWRDAIMWIIMGVLALAIGVLCVIAFFLECEMLMYFMVGAMGAMYSISGIVLIVEALIAEK